MKETKIHQGKAFFAILVTLVLVLVTFYLLIQNNQKQELRSLGIENSSQEALGVSKKLAGYKSKAEENAELSDGTLMGLVKASPTYLEGMVKFNEHIIKAINNEEYLESEAWKDKLLEITSENYVSIHSLVYNGSDEDVHSALIEFQNGYSDLERQTVKTLIENDSFNLELLVDEVANFTTLSRSLTDALARNYE